MKKAFSIASELKPMEIDLVSHQPKLAKEYHLSLSRTVPIRVHQINSIVAMLQHKFECQKGLVLFSCLKLNQHFFSHEHSADIFSY